MPFGPRATMVKAPEPVILQTIFTSVPVRGGTPESDSRSPHNSALMAVPCTSGPDEELSIGDAGWQFFRPGAVGPVIASEGVGVDVCLAGREGVGELVEHAVSTMRSRKRQRACTLTKWFLPNDIADASPVVHCERRKAKTLDSGALL